MAADPNISIGVKIGESQAEIRKLKKELQELSSEFGKNGADMKYATSESDKYAAAQGNLAQQLEKQKEITALNAGLLKQQGDNAAKYAAQLKELEKAKAKMAEGGNNTDTTAFVKLDEAMSRRAFHRLKTNT